MWLDTFLRQCSGLPSMASIARLHRESCARNVQLNLARGKPSPEQLDLMAPMLAWSAVHDHHASDETDCRNYSDNAGLPELRALFAPIMGVTTAQVVAGGNSSLALMHDFLAFATLNGVPGSDAPWSRVERPSILCPVPGYDRHFFVAAALGIQMIPVPTVDDGPDMDCVEALARESASIKAMWCMPRYSNPTGVIYSAQSVRRLAALKAAAADFRLLWDDAYALHDLTNEPAVIPNIIDACREAGHTDRAVVFTSTSKITLAGAGVAFLASSPANIAWWLARAVIRSIGPDKLNQLRHVRFLQNETGLRSLMAKHRQILAPKFAAVDEVFSRVLRLQPQIRWTKPRGGYFIALTVAPGTARRTIELAAQAGVNLTPAGACFPYGVDPDDRVIRIAPTFPSVDEVREAAAVVAVSALLAVAEIHGGADAASTAV